MNWKSLKESIPVFSFLVTLIVLVYQNIYYQYFGIRINHYMQLQEVFLVIADKLIIILPAILIYSVILLAGEPPKNDELQNKETGLKRYISLSYIASYIALGFGFFVYFRENNYNTHFIARLIIFAALITFIYKEIRVYYLREYKRELSQTIFRLFSMLLTIAFILGLILMFEINSVTKGKYIGTKILTQDSTYTSDSSNYYIGKTDKYIFLYNDSSKTSTIIPTETVKKIYLKEK